jgi:hypothetical protein
VALAVVTRIPSYMEAQIAVGALRSGGIDAQLFDGNFGQVESPVIESLGGFRIMAPEEQVAAAREVLRALRASPGLGEPDEMGPWSASLGETRRTRGRGLRLVTFLLLSAPFLLWLLVRLVGAFSAPSVTP